MEGDLARLLSQSRPAPARGQRPLPPLPKRQWRRVPPGVTKRARGLAQIWAADFLVTLLLRNVKASDLYDEIQVSSRSPAF